MMERLALSYKLSDKQTKNTLSGIVHLNSLLIMTIKPETVPLHLI